MSATTLLPCPFCGGEPVVLDEVDADTELWVWCLGCGAAFGHNLKADALAAWNRRAAPTVADAQRARELADFLVVLGMAFEKNYAMDWDEVERNCNESAGLLRRLAGGTDGR